MIRFKTSLQRTFRPKRLNFLYFVLIFGVIGGIVALLLTRAATPIQIDSGLPQVRNVRVVGDDRLITVSWDAPQGASAAGIVGYFIEYGETALGTFPHTKQTTHTTTQLQPVDNGKQYSIKIYAAHGSTVMVDTPGAHEDNSAPEKRGSGRVSNPVIVTATPSSTRVDQLRASMTGFFDDFNTPMGAFDELKWNQGGSACGMPGTAAAFINSQFHTHNQISTISDDGEYCDRGQFATRARGIFDIAGRTESNPGVVVFDMDGATRGRDVWYLDLIPITARIGNAPVDVTAHGSAFDDESSDPSMIRLVQGVVVGGVNVVYYDANKNPHEVTELYSCNSCMDDIIPNVRKPWRVEVSSTKIKVFVEGTRVFEGVMPAEFANVTKYQLHSTIFSYNTGKGDSDNPMTFMFHWDNFGFNGPQSPTVVHNYIEGGSAGNTPYLGRGTLANRVPGGARNTIVKIPDQIGSPSKARMMFTLGACGPGWYTHSSSHNVTINGNVYPYTHPSTKVPAPVWSDWTGSQIANGYNPLSTFIDINPAHLITGNNQVRLNIDGHHQCIFNVHIELEYARGTQPSYTQPKDVYGQTLYNSYIMPPLAPHDAYIFVEQNLGLASASDGHDSGNILDARNFEAEEMIFGPPVISGNDPNASKGKYILFQ